jgi:hypothetical protein
MATVDTTRGGANRVPIATLKGVHGFGKTHLRFSDKSDLTPCGQIARTRLGDLLGHADVLAAVDCQRCQRSTSALVHRLREQRETAANLPAPAPNRVGEFPHAYPNTRVQDTTCTNCGEDVFYDDTDCEETGIWTHTATLDYFCEPAE